MKVRGLLDLSFRAVEMYLQFRQCTLSGGIFIHGARLRGLEFNNVVTGAINAWSVFVEGLLRFDHAQIDGMLHVGNARVAGDFVVFQSRLESGGLVAINAPSLNVDGNLTFDASSFTGRFNLVSAVVSGDLTVIGANIAAPSSVAIMGDGIKVSGRCFIRSGTTIEGSVRLLGAKIDGEMDLSGAKISRVDEIALDVRNARVGGKVFLTNGFHADGRVTFYAAEIGGEFSAQGGKISLPDSAALDLQVCRIGGGVILSGGFVAEGAALLYGATINGDLNCQGANISGSNQWAMDIRRTSIKGAAFFIDGFHAGNIVSLFGAKVEGDVVVSKAEITASYTALNLSSATVTGVRIVDSTIKGSVELVGATLSSGLYVNGSRLVPGRNPTVFNAASSRCDGIFYWHPADASEGTLNLEHAHVDGLDDDVDAWPPTLRLDGFTYDNLVTDAAKTVASRLEWLARQPRYYSQPFEQLIATYRKLGDSESAAEVAIRKWRSRRQAMPKRSFDRGWDVFLDWSSGYGYRPGRLLLALAVLIGIGTAVFYWGKREGVFCAANVINPQQANVVPCARSPAYPSFNPLVYSFETLSPVGDFGQRRLYVVRADNWASVYIEIYSLVHKFLGWIISLLLALAPTNILKRE